MSKLTITREMTLAELRGLQSGEFAEVSISCSGATLADEVQEEAFRLLQPNGKLCVQQIATREEGNALSRDLKIQGFVCVIVAKESESTGGLSDESRFLVCQKPDYTMGTSAPLSLPAKQPAAVAKWTMDTSDLADADLIDESALLDEADLMGVPSREEKDAGGCGVPASGPKRACKNCSCGLAEQEAADMQGARPQLTAAQAEVKASSCGGCYKVHCPSPLPVLFFFASRCTPLTIPPPPRSPSSRDRATLFAAGAVPSSASPPSSQGRSA